MIFFLKMQKMHLKSPQWTSKPLNSCFNFHNGPEYAIIEKIIAIDPVHSGKWPSQIVFHFNKRQSFLFCY